MVCGRGGEWARGRLAEVTRLVDASTGGLPHLWVTCGRDHQAFTNRVTQVLDAILPSLLPDADLDEDLQASPGSASSSATSPSTPSPATEASEGCLGDGREAEGEDEEALARLHRVFKAVPYAQLPKSGGGVFLRAQQLVEACQQQPGVLAGATIYKDRVLNSQMGSQLTTVLASLPLQHQLQVLEERRVGYRLPAGVQLHQLHVPAAAHSDLRRYLPKPLPRRGDRSLHSDTASMDLNCLRSVLQSRQSLHNYPSTLPVAPEAPSESSISSQEQKAAQNPVKGPSLLSRISRGIESELRPSQSLPGSPRKIRVAATLPDVGSNSPDLRYKVLTGRKPRPPSSTHASPRRMPGGRSRMTRNNDVTSNGISNLPKRGNSLGPPSLTRADKKITLNNKTLCNTGEPGKTHVKFGYDSEKSESGFEDGVQSDSELNIKNTKNKLNLHLAPDKINRPSHEIELDTWSNDEPKIMREINGNLSKDYDSCNRSPNGNIASLKAQEMDFRDESDTSRSEESDISVLDISKFMETKENGDRQLAEAVKDLMELTRDIDDEELLNPARDTVIPDPVEDEECGRSAEGWELLTLYTQKLSDTVLHLLLAPSAVSSPQLTYGLWRLGVAGLGQLEAAVERALELAEVDLGGDAFMQWSHSVLSATMPAALDLRLTALAHHDFSTHTPLMEITLRSSEAVLWAHRHSNTQTFYQVNAAPRPGLPIPSDVMAKVAHRARRRLDRDRNITLL